MRDFDGTLGSGFSGIGGFDLAAERIGLDPVWHSDIEPSVNRVMAHHFPSSKLIDDITKVNARSAQWASIFTGGSPCQGFSIAGVGLGMDDPRSGLFGQFIRIVNDMQPRWAVWENVPGVLTSSRGKDIAHALAALVGAGTPLDLPRHPNGRRGRYAGVARGPRGTVAWRVLDAQHFGVPQRRRRIIAVVHLGGERAGEVLHERQGVSRGAGTGDPAGDGASPSASPRVDGGGGAVAPGDVPGGGGPHSLTPVVMRQREGKPGGGKGPLLSTDRTLTLATGNDQYLFEPVTFRKVRRAASDEDFETWEASEQSNTLNTYENSDVRATTLVVEGFPDPAGTLTTRYFKGINTTLDDGAIVVEMETGERLRMETDDGVFFRVRRLTPTEGERLQGFPDGWTEPAGSDSARWKAIGNAVAVPVAEWVLRRIVAVEANL